MKYFMSHTSLLINNRQVDRIFYPRRHFLFPQYHTRSFEKHANVCMSACRKILSAHRITICACIFFFNKSSGRPLSFLRSFRRFRNLFFARSHAGIPKRILSLKQGYRSRRLWNHKYDLSSWPITHSWLCLWRGDLAAMKGTVWNDPHKVGRRGTFGVILHGADGWAALQNK